MPAISRARTRAGLSRRIGLLALCVGLLGGTPAQAQAQQSLSFFKNYFVTGDYVVRGVSLFGTGQNGTARAAIRINDFPEDSVDLLAAFLYVQTAEPIGSPGAGIHNAQFNGFALGPSLPPSLDPNDPDPYQSYMKPLTGTPDTPVCWIKQPGYRMVTYRGDVLRFLSVKANGKHQVNGSHPIA